MAFIASRPVKFSSMRQALVYQVAHGLHFNLN